MVCLDRTGYPPPLMTSTPGSFAEKTIRERKPQIIAEVAQAYPYPPEILSELKAFAREIASEPIRPLHEDAPDVDLWQEAWSEHEGHSWFDVPWYFAETYFYRRLMEVVRYYQPGPWFDVDPFAPQKAAALEGALPAFAQCLDQPHSDAYTAFVLLLHETLWGNRADLSNRTIAAMAEGTGTDPSADRLLIDDTARIWQHLNAHPGARVDIVADNSGLELLLDIRLAEFLVAHDLAEVRFHLKRMPFFVSDAMIRDFWHTLACLETFEPIGKRMVRRMRETIDKGTVSLRDDPFWSTCLSYHQIPDRIDDDLSASHLVLFKGDVNYRRVLDDRQWPHTARLSDIAGHLPAPFGVLRTLKGELIVGLAPGQAEELQAQDPRWMINGERGVIQFVHTGRGGIGLQESSLAESTSSRGGLSRDLSLRPRDSSTPGQKASPTLGMTGPAIGEGRDG